MPHVGIPSARLWYEEAGRGQPLVCLHSGWGRLAMPFDDAAAVLGPSHRLVFPDRRGYGRSTPLDDLPVTYHRDAAVDLGHFLDALSLERVPLWGHSDGAISAALFAADHPERVSALVLEAIHFHRAKSREFFERFAENPDSLPPSLIERLRADHGEDRWRTVIRMHSRVWLSFHAIGGGFFEGTPEANRFPGVLLFGGDGPHPAPGEAAAIAP